MRRIALVALLMSAAVAAFLYWRWPPAALPPPPTEAEIEALGERRDALQVRLRDIIVANGERSLGEAPVGDVMIGIPTSFTRTVIQQVTTGLFEDMTLALEDLKVHKEGDVKVKVLFGRKTVGHYVLDVRIHRLRGTLKPGPPAVEFSTDRVAIRLPVNLAAGTSSADVHLQWDSKGLVASSVCGDTNVTKTVTGGVIPQDYVLRGAFRITSVGEAIVLRPDFREDLKLRIFVDPSEQAWQAVEEVVKAQRAGCEAVLNKVDIKEILGQIVGRGFDVRIPAKVIKPIRLPAGIRQSLEMQGVRVALQVKATGLKLTSGRLWYGANVALETSKPSRLPTSP